METTTRRKYIIATITRWQDATMINELMNSVDFFNVETENFYAPFHLTSITGPLAPLYSSNKNSIDDTMKWLICKTGKPSLFDMILPFRGSYFENVNQPVNDSLYRNVDLVNGTSQGGLIIWREMEARGFDFKKAIWHEESKIYFFCDEKRERLYTFDDPRSLKEKVSYAVSKNLGGVAIRQLEYDDNANTHLNAVRSIDLCSNIKEDAIKYNCDGYD
uniref:Glyco_hydro_18 domain-containing protein n=1 Tax=Caenorhabditis tropicalis TaxID=1561998 RepID=A0A1I7TUS5_9PELO